MSEDRQMWSRAKIILTIGAHFELLNILVIGLITNFLDDCNSSQSIFSSSSRTQSDH